MDVDEPVVVVDYDPDWELAAEEEIGRLGSALSDWHVQIEHIGSTAVPGCAAKPIVDLQVGTVSGQEGMVAEAITRVGYESMGEAQPGRFYLRRRSPNFNVHVIDVSGHRWQSNLALRDYLRDVPSARNNYSNAKKQAASVEPMLLAYSRAKDPVLARLIKRANVHND